MAFELFKNNFPKGFAGFEGPLVVMTDDGTAERSALAEVWPDARRLLCVFHVLSAEWKWLLSNCNKKHRQELMNLFQKAVYAENQKDFVKSVDDIHKKSTKFPKFVKRFDRFLKRADEWAIFERTEVIVRNNDTNNYSENSIKIVKEAVLQRMKAFNPVALIEFIIGPLDDYYVRRLLEHAHNRHLGHALLFDKLIKRAENIDPERIVKLDENLFSVLSSEHNGQTYEVRVDSGFCTCKSGERGSFCKHQALLVKYKGVTMPSAPPLLSSDRELLAKTALGYKALQQGFYLGRTEVAPTTRLENSRDV